MKKNKAICFVIIFVIIVLLLIPKEDNNIRIRVIANSNNYSDLYTKEEVYNIIKEEIKANYNANQITKAIPKLEEKLNKYAKENSITIDLSFGYTSFPPKELNGVISSGGSYKTLLVTIGKAEGSNYWTLLYPEYFNITFEDINSGEVEIKFFFFELFK